MSDLDSALTRLDDEHAAATALLADLRRDFTGMVDASADSNADDEHDPEGSTIAFERSQVTTMIDQTARRLAEIDAARARVADGTYGRCEVCGRPIAPARLEAMPSATRCIEHASQP